MRVTTRGLVIAVGASVGIAALGVLAGTVALRRMVNADLLESVINEAVGAATEGRYRVEVGPVEVHPWQGDLAVQGVHLRPTGFGTDDAEPEGGNALRFSSSVEEVSIRGVDLIRLVRDRDLEADAYTMASPRLTLIVIEREAPPIMGAAAVTELPDGSDETPSARELADSVIADSAATLHGAVAAGLPHIHVGRVDILDVDASIVTLSREGGQAETPLHVQGLSLTLDDLRIDPNEPMEADRFLFARDVRLSFDSLDLRGAKGGSVALGPVAMSTRGQSLRFDHVTLRPSHTAAEYLLGLGPAGDHVQMTVGPVSVQGLQWWKLAESLDAVATTVRIDGLDIDVLGDDHRPSRPSSGPPTMPHDVMRELALGITLDTVVVSDASVTYSKRGSQSERPGSVSFEDIQARFTNVTNDPDRAAERGPTMLEAETRVFGAAPASIRASIPLLGPPPTMFFFARIGAFDASALNAILPDLEGMRVTEGRVDSARVDIRYRADGASGVVMVGYEGLELRQEDRNTGEQSFGQRLTSFVANTFVIRGDNRPGDDRPPREGRVEYVRPPDASFFKQFWHAIRDGLIDVAKR